MQHGCAYVGYIATWKYRHCLRSTDLPVADQCKPQEQHPEIPLFSAQGAESQPPPAPAPAGPASVNSMGKPSAGLAHAVGQVAQPLATPRKDFTCNPATDLLLQST